MAPSGLTAVLSGLLLLTNGSLAATLHERDSSLVRRESERSVQLSSAGQFIDEASKPGSTPSCAKCEEYDYLLGKKGQNECRNPENETLVTDDNMCRYAAQRAGAHTDADNIFKVSDFRSQKTRPYGCFHMKCNPAGAASAAETNCYFVNLGARVLSNDTGTHFRGTPICKRKLYADGGQNGQGGCPAEYKVIMNETLCNEMCGIDDFKCNEFFRIGVQNYTQHHDFPKGCFHLRHENQNGSMTRVYFNKVSDGTAVSGTPMCVVAKPLNFAQASKGAETKEDETPTNSSS